MNILRKIARVLLATSLRVSLTSLALTLALLAAVGSSEPVKTSLEQSGVYDVTVDSVLEQSANQEDSESATIPLDDPNIQAAAKDAFNPGLIEQSAEQAVDGVYNWLEGETENLEFSINLTDAKEDLIDNLVAYAEERVSGLRPCSAVESQQFLLQSYDPFTDTCRPPVAIADIKADVRRELNNSEDFLPDPVITNDNLGNNGDAENSLPEAFQLLNTLPVILVVVAVLSAIGLVFIHQDKRKGLMQVSGSLLGSGFFLLISALILQFIVNRASLSSLFEGSDGLQTALVETIRLLYGYFGSTLLLIAGIYTVVGAVSLVILWYLGRRNTKNHPQPSPEPQPTPQDTPPEQTPPSNDEDKNKN